MVISWGARAKPTRQAPLGGNFTPALSARCDVRISTDGRVTAALPISGASGKRGITYRLASIVSAAPRQSLVAASAPGRQGNLQSGFQTDHARRQILDLRLLSGHRDCLSDHLVIHLYHC